MCKILTKVCRKDFERWNHFVRNVVQSLCMFTDSPKRIKNIFTDNIIIIIFDFISGIFF